MMNFKPSKSKQIRKIEDIKAGEMFAHTDRDPVTRVYLRVINDFPILDGAVVIWDNISSYTGKFYNGRNICGALQVIEGTLVEE